MSPARSHGMAQTFADSVWLSAYIEELCALAFVSLPLTWSNFIFEKVNRKGIVLCLFEVPPAPAAPKISASAISDWNARMEAIENRTELDEGLPLNFSPFKMVD